ncbi:DUF2971 domain-containing protein [Methylobacterium radiotolerans]|uniref:DUF2971 domain-containing protein n=1 Tax=Methylobacterium radiotolerans TaxID=31998 RepID=UPI000D5E5235|nr:MULTISPECIES: DUF2971 domain-containing protein [Methylobacterium]MDE3749378.1 DUF2971 domain-containing protein [Methylobacterium radiotolerans]PVY93938.1 hypothetical protein C7388_1314 [Methylobacterium organophilum]
MDDTNARNLIRLQDADLDRPIYRIYELDRFKAMLASGRDAVVNPTKWQDPFEDFFLERTEVMDDVSKTTIPLRNLAGDWYGQCWSLHEDTDAMWRIYSPDPKVKPGVKVKTTIRRLFENLKASGSPAPYLQFFIGEVQYLTELEIRQMMSGLTFTDVAIGGQGDRFADLLCIKRDAFRHEAEVRLMFQDIDPKRGSGGVFLFPRNANTLFDEAVLDPRLKDPDAAALTTDLQNAGCTLRITRSSLYESPRFVIPA